jgi:hypothetical protein
MSASSSSMTNAPAAPSAPSDELVSYLWARRQKTLYRIRVSTLYHLKRERFFDTIDKITSILTALSATFAVGVLLKKVEDLELSVSALTAALSLVPLVFNPADKARKHGQAAAEFRRLLADCERAGERWEESLCDQFAARVVELEATEPAPLCALVADCENQLNIATGSSKRIHLLWHERLLKQWVDFDAAAIHERSVKRNASAAAAKASAHNTP